MHRSALSLFIVAVVWMTPWTGEGASGPHRGVGIIAVLDGSQLLVQESGGAHEMTIDARTRIVIVDDDRVGAIGVGDYVAEECVSDGQGGVHATRIALLRPAWKELASPEN